MPGPTRVSLGGFLRGYCGEPFLPAQLPENKYTREILICIASSYVKNFIFLVCNSLIPRHNLPRPAAAASLHFATLDIAGLEPAPRLAAVDL